MFRCARSAEPGGGCQQDERPYIRSHDKRLKIARTVYKALSAQNPDRQITLCDRSGRMLARSERPSDEDVTEKA